MLKGMVIRKRGQTDWNYSDTTILVHVFLYKIRFSKLSSCLRSDSHRKATQWLDTTIILHVAVSATVQCKQSCSVWMIMFWCLVNLLPTPDVDGAEVSLWCHDRWEEQVDSWLPAGTVHLAIKLLFRVMWRSQAIITLQYTNLIHIYVGILMQVCHQESDFQGFQRYRSFPLWLSVFFSVCQFFRQKLFYQHQQNMAG